MAGRVLKAQKVSDPIVRTVEIRDMYDNSLNDLEETWNDLGRLKSTLRNIGHRVDDAADVRPAISACGISREPQRKAKQPGEPLESLPHYRPRKVCRLDEKYADSDADGRVNVPPYRPASSRHVAFKNFDSGDDTGSRLSSEALGADSKNTGSFNMTDSRAERETERKFLNDSVSPVLRGLPEMQRVSAEPDMEPWLRRVNVRVPKALTTTGMTSSGENPQANLDAHRKRPTVKDVAEGDLSKLQETIRKQRAKSSPTVGSDVRDGSARAAALDGRDPRAAPEDLAAACSVKPRKVASLPAAKAYLGFSRPQQLSPRISKQTGAKGTSAAPSDLATTVKAKPAAIQQQVTECDGRTDGVHAANSNKITPSSWRAGLRLVRQELGLPVSSGDPAASHKTSGDARAAASQSPRAVSAPAAGAKQRHQQPSLRPSRADARSAVVATSGSRSAVGNARLHSYHSSTATAPPAAGVSSRLCAAQQAGEAATAAASAMGAVRAAVETPDSSEPAAAEGVHAEPISELVNGIASGSLALSDTAKDVLRELQSDAGLQEKRAASRKIGWESVHNGSPEHVTVKRQLRGASAASVGAGQPSSKSRGHVADGRAAASTPPPQKTRHYDAEDIQRYMQRKKSEERRQRAAEAAAKRKADEEHQKKLQELFKKQKRVHRPASASIRPSQAVSSLRVAAHSVSGSSGAIGASAVCNDTFTRNQLASSGGSSVGCGAPAACDSDKENRGSSAGSATPTSGSDGPPSSHATPDRSVAAGSARAAVALSERPASVGRDTPSPVSRPVVNGTSSAGGVEDEGLLSFADDNLKRILNKYKSRRESDVHHVAAADARLVAQRPSVVPTVERRLGSGVVEPLLPPSQLSGPLSTDPANRSHVDRIASIKKATSLLTEKIHAAQARLADYCLSGQEEPTRSMSGQRRGHKEHVVSALPHTSVRSFASSMSDGGRRSVQNRMLNSWPGVSNGGGGGVHAEQAPKHRTSAASRRVESLSSLSDNSTQESMHVSDAYRDSLLLNEASESQEDKLSDTSATDSLTVESKVVENAGVADRIARSLRQSAFCVSSRQSDNENLFATHPRQLSYYGSAVPQQTVIRGQPLQTGNGFHEDVAYRVLSRSTPPRPYADYYSSINVHLRKASASRRGAAEPGCCLPLRHDREPVTSTGMQRALHVSPANPVHLTAVHPERARSPEYLSTVVAAAASADDAAAVDTAVSRRVTSSLLQDVDESLSDSRVLPVEARGDPNGSRNRHFESEDRPIDGSSSAAFTNLGDLFPATGAVVAGRSVSQLLPTEPHPVIVQPDQLRHAETLPPKTEDSTTGVSSRLVSQSGQPYSSIITRGGADTLLGTSPLGLGFRMAAELNLLDSVEESVRALTDVELTRHAAAAQQEAARLTLLLEGTKHSQELELRQLRAKVRAEEEEAQRQLEAMRRQAHTAELERDSVLDERRRMESQSLTLYHSTRQLVESQMDATRASLEATRSLAEVAAAAGRDEHIRRREAAQIAAEAASLSAAAAVTASLDRQRQEQAEFFRMARQHVYDRSVQVSASLKVDSSRSDGKYGTSFESASDDSQASPRDREGKRLSPKTTDEELLSGPNSTPERAMSTSPSVLSQASATDSHSSATVVESEHIRTADVSSVSAVSSVDAGVVGHKRAKTGKQLSDSSIATASSLADAEGGRGRGATALVHDRFIASIATDTDLNGNARSLRGSITNEESANGSSVKTLSDVQAIVHRQAAVEGSKRHTSSSSPSASVLTTEAVRLHDRQTAGDRGVLPLEVKSGRGKQQQVSLDRIGSTSSDGSTVRSEAGAYGSPKAVAEEAADEDYTQDFYETSNASADESSADVRQAGVKRRVAAPVEPDKQRSPRVQKHASAGEAALASTTSPDDTGKVHANRALAAGASSHSASHALAVVRQLIRDEKLRALHEEQLARAKYRAINYKSKFELQTIATQKEIASLKGNTDVVAELETRTATLAESFSRKKAAIQSKLRSDRSYNNSRLESLRERYAELAAATKDLGAGVAAQLAELSAPLDDVDLSLSESSISSSAGETNIDFTAPRIAKGQRNSSWPAVGYVAATSQDDDRDGGHRTPNRGSASVGTSAQSAAPDVVDLSVARTSSALHTEENSAQQCDTEITPSTKRPAASGSPDSMLAAGAEARAAGQTARRKLLAQQVSAGNRSRATRHGDSESDDSISMSVPEGGTGSESDTEGRIQALQYQLRLKQKEETRLKRLLTDAERERRRERKRNQETALLKQLELTEENIARLNASLREVQQQRHTPPASDDGTEGLRAVHAASASALGTPAAALHDPSSSSASITKPLIKQPRAALQQVSAPAVSSSPSAAAGPLTAVPSASADTARLPSTVLPSLRSDSEGSLHSSPDVEGESSIIGLVFRAEAEAQKSPDNKIVGDGVGHKQTSPETPSNDLRAAEMVDVAGRDRGDSDEIPKEYSSDSFADSYSSEEQRENDESKSESVPEELPEEVPEDGDFKQSSLRCESEDSTEASRRSSPELLPRERGRSPTESAAAAPGTGTAAPPQSAALKETGADYSIAESFDYTGGDESLSARPRSLSDSSSEAPGYGEVPRLLPDPSLSPLPGTPKVEGDPKAASDFGSDDAHSVAAARERAPVGAAADVRPVSTDSSIAEEDIPASAASSDGTMAPENAADALQHAVQSSLASQADVVTVDLAGPQVQGSATQSGSRVREPSVESDPIVPLSTRAVDELHADSTLLDKGRQPLEKHSVDERATDRYDSEHFDSDFSTASISLPSESSPSVQSESAAAPLSATDVPDSALPAIGTFASAATSGLPDASGEAAVSRLGTGDEESVPIVEEALHRSDKRLTPTASESDHEGSDKDASWSASDDGRVQDVVSAAERDLTRREEIVRTGDSGKLPSPTQESSKSESIHESLEHEPSAAADSETSAGLLLEAAADAVSALLPPAVAAAPKDVNSAEPSVCLPQVASEPADDSVSIRSPVVLVEKLADWLLKDAILAYVTTRNAKLEAARALETAKAVTTSAPSTSASTQKPIDATVTPVSSAEAVKRDVVVVADAIEPKGSQKDTPQSRAEVSSSASSASLADLPPLTPKKSLTLREAAGSSTGPASESSRLVTSAPAKQPAAAATAAGGLPVSSETKSSSRPLSPVLGGSGIVAGLSSDADDAWIKLDKEINNVFGEDVDWFDEDFGLGVSKKPGASPAAISAQKPGVAQQSQPPPPPYPGAAEGLRHASKVEAKVQTPPAPLAVIPEKREDVVSLALRAVDVFWQMRRFGESWEGATPPEEYTTEAVGGAVGLEAASKASHGKMMFDLVGEMLREIYREESDSDMPESRRGGSRLKLPSRRYWKGKTPPSTVDELRKVVEQHIFKVIGCQPQVKSIGIGPRARKKDRVDGILIEELRQEEADWVNYTDDEDAVKETVFNDIFNLLIVDTGKSVAEAMRLTQRYSK